GAVLRVALRGGVAGEVQPHRGPALAVGGRLEQTVDQLLVRPGIGVLRKAVGLLDGGREAGEIDGQAADEAVPVGFTRRLETLLLEAREKESVDLVPRPRRILHRR